jgi:hypothetical protein
MSKRNDYAGSFYQGRVMTPNYRNIKYSSIDSSLRKSEQFIKKSLNLDESSKSSPGSPKIFSSFNSNYVRQGQSSARTAKSIKLSSLISTLMTRNLGIKEKEEAFTPGTSNLSNFFKIKAKKDDIKAKKSLNVQLVFNPDYYKPEYVEYITDVGRNVVMEKYIGQNFQKKRKQVIFLNRFGRV